MKLVSLLGLLSLLGLVVFLVLLIVSFFKKSRKQQWVIGILSSLLCFFIALYISIGNELNVANEGNERLRVEKESVEQEMKSKELHDLMVSTATDVFSQQMGENVYTIDNAVIFVIPIKGDTEVDVVKNTMSKQTELVEYASMFAHIPGLTGKEHFYFKTIDKDANIIAVQYFRSDGEAGDWSIGSKYLSYINLSK